MSKRKKQKSSPLFAVLLILVVLVLVGLCLLGRNGIYLVSSGIRQKLGAAEGIGYAVSFDLPDGRVAHYFEAGTKRFDERLERFKSARADELANDGVWKFGNREDIAYCISGTEKGDLLYRFAGMDGATWGEIFETVYGVTSADDLRWVILTPNFQLLKEYPLEFIKSGVRVIRGEELEALFGAIAPGSCESVPFEARYLGIGFSPTYSLPHGLREKDVLAPGDSAEKHSARLLGWYNVTVVAKNREVLLRARYDANFGTLSFHWGQTDYILPASAAESINAKLWK